MLRTALAEVCGTDVHLRHGRLSGVPYPIIPGHVTTGVLDRIRGDVTDPAGQTLCEGDRVAFFDVHRTCGRCLACTVDRTPTRCPSRRVYGITDSAAEGLYGGWAQKVYLEPGVTIAKLPDSVTFEAFIGGGCGLQTSVHIIERARLSPGDTVVVQGAGAVGLSAAALARVSGAGQVIVIGAPASRLDLALRMGADRIIDLDRTTALERRTLVRDRTRGRGADVVIEAAGSARAFEEGLDLARDGGTFVIAGHYTNAGDSTLNVHNQINRKHLDIRGCWGSEVRHFLAALAALERHGPVIPWQLIGSKPYALGDINAALAAAEAMTVTKAVIDPWK
jgi:L-iditol 2-dehydrogenase